MARYYIDTREGHKYIKDIDYANGTLTFTTNSDDAYHGRDGYYANATKDLLIRGFKEEYPEIAKLKCEY